MSSNWGNNIKVSLFGESHGMGIGVVIDGLPAGERLDEAAIQKEMNRRAPGNDPASTARREEDVPEICSGVLAGVTTGAPLCA
ncbi:MAG: chorismate synthase, partial [Oscillospiraceae bacterium]|nr:chorismate synthase [Oscillospiraceae bacterium]